MAADEENKRKKREYESSPLVITIKQLVEDFPLGWKGTAGDLLKRVFDITGKPYSGSPWGLEKNCVISRNNCTTTA